MAALPSYLDALEHQKQLEASLGFMVETAEDGLDALEKIQNETPAALVLDLQMPRMDGVQLVNELQARGLALRTIVVSANPARAAALKCDAVVEKPFDPDELVAVVNRTLQCSCEKRLARRR